METPFEIGTEFTFRGKSKKKGVVIDHLTTTNSKGNVVKFRYRVNCLAFGSEFTDNDVTHTTIKMSLEENK